MEVVVLIDRAQGDRTLWEEVGRVEVDVTDGGGVEAVRTARRAMWAAARAELAVVVPGSPAEERLVKLVPARYWDTIRSLVDQAPLVPRAEGL